MGLFHPKKVAAAVAAVLQCVAESEASIGVLGDVAASRTVPGGVWTVPSLWGWAGRQDAMRDRVLCQRRSSKSW